MNSTLYQFILFVPVFKSFIAKFLYLDSYVDWWGKTVKHTRERTALSSGSTTNGHDIRQVTQPPRSSTSSPEEPRA